MNTDIQTIDQSGMLATDELQAIQAVSKSVEAGFARRQRFRPRFLMETAVLNDMKFPTPDAKYWQCNVERDTHFRNLVLLSFDYREKLADIDILEEEITKLSGPHYKKTLVQIERERASLIYMQKEARERVREITNWSDIMQKLEPNLKHDPDDIEAHMPEAYAIRYGREQEMMRLAQGQSDMSGAMNILSVGRTIGDHPSVKKLIEDAHTAQIEGGNTHGKEVCKS